MDFLFGAFNSFINNLPEGLQIEGLRYLFGAGSIFLLTWVIFSGVLASRRIRKPLPTASRNKQILREIGNSTLSIFVFVFAYSFTEYALFQLWGTSVFKIYPDVATYGWPYLIFSVILWTAGLDTYFYWTHRLMHHKKLYRFFHLTHHRSHNPTPFTAYSFAPPEAVLVYLFVPLFFTLVPMHDVAFVSAMLVQITRNAIAHCGYEIFPRNWTRHPILGIFSTVTHHDMHHEKSNGNYGFYFTFWDRIMGTEHAHYEERFDRATQGSNMQRLAANN
ncbi:MAG: lathosterol oxidase [Gammaproteobacteria bacterium]|jgi:lathosterol oxidase